MTESTNPSEKKAKEWYKKPLGMVVAILILPFFAIWYAWAKSNWSKNIKIGVTVASLIFVVIALAASPDSSVQTNSTAQTQSQAKQEQPQAPKPKAKFEGSILSNRPINPATLQFVAEVKNTGDGEGKFSCTVRGKDASSTYTGFDIFEDEGGTLKPGESRTFNGVITIKKEGAYYVSDVSISCN